MSLLDPPALFKSRADTLYAAYLLGAQADLMRKPIKVSILGNSFAAQIANWFDEMCAASGGLLQFDYNGGVSGNTTAQMLARVADIPSTSRACFVLEGTNDAGGSVTAPTHAANLLAICQALQTRGIMPILCMSPPKDGSGSFIAQYRVAEYQIARKYGFLLYDPFGGYFDSTSTTGNWTAGASVGDGVHPSQTTYRDAGRAISDQLRGFVSRGMVQPKNNGWAGMVTNNLNLTSTSGLGAQWSKTGTPTTTIVSAAGDGVLGNWQVSTVTAASGTHGVVTGLTLPSGAVDTDEYLVHVAVKGTATSGSPGFSLFVRWRDASTAGIRDDFFAFNSVIGTFPAKYWERVLTPPTGTASAQLFARTEGASAYTADISVGEVVVVNLTRAAGF